MTEQTATERITDAKEEADIRSLVRSQIAGGASRNSVFAGLCARGWNRSIVKRVVFGGEG